MALADRLPDLDALRTLREETHLETILVRVAGFARARLGEWHALARDSERTGVRLGIETEDELVVNLGPPAPAPLPCHAASEVVHAVSGSP